MTVCTVTVFHRLVNYLPEHSGLIGAVRRMAVDTVCLDRKILVGCTEFTGFRIMT